MLSRRKFLAGISLGLLAAASDPVSLARRLLMAGGGGGSFTLPATLTAAALTTAPEGGWSWFEDPRALAHGDYTYVGYNDDGDLQVVVITAGAVVNTITVAAAFEDDDHDTPTFYVDPINDKLVVWYSKHLGANIYMRVSTNTLTADPSLSGGFAAAVDYATTFELAANRFFTYPSPLYTSDADGSGDDAMWLFYRCHEGRVPGVSDGDAQWHYNASTDGGATWSGTSVRLHTLTYSKVESDGVGKIHMGITEGPGIGENDETKVWHMYRGSGAWRDAAGTPVSGSFPLEDSDLPVVFDGSGDSDKVWISDIALIPDGKPVIVFARYPGGDLTDHRAMYAAWNGSSWDVNEVCVMGNPGSIGYSDTYHPGLSLDHDDPQIVYVGRWISGTTEMFKYTTNDGGATFAENQLTSGSSDKNIRPVGVRAQADIPAVWLYGTYTDYVDYSLGIRGLVP